MNTRTSSLLSRGGLLLALAAAVAVCLLVLGSSALATPSEAPLAQAITGVPVTTLPASTCTLDGLTRTCELWAMAGTITMPTGLPVPVWGFADTSTGPAQVPGPALIANAGETLEVVLHNELPGETVSLAFPGQVDLPPDQVDLVGVGTGSTVTYTFPVGNPGTFLYEAGLTPNGSRQVAMGLHGGLIVRPAAAGQAYDSPATAYDDEALLVLSEIDPLFNIDPYSFPIHQFSPRYWLINGKAYSDTAPIDTYAGNTILLRYVNAGLKSHWMGVLGLEQRIIGSDGQPRALSHEVVAQTVAAGQTVDALVAVPSTAMTTTLYALYDTNMLLHNASDRDPAGGPLNFGGMMTFIRTVSGTAQFIDGPVATLQLDPTNTTGADGVELTVRLDDTAHGGQVITAAEYFVDSVGAVGTGTSLPVPAPAVVVTLTEFIPATALDGWSSGAHVLYARGSDIDGNWGFVGSAVLNLDKAGPSSSAMSLHPEPTNGQSDVLLRATGDDHSTGGNNVVAGAYSIDGGTVQPLNLSRTDSPIVAMTATLPSDPLLLGLAEGLHPIEVSAQDSLGTWGMPGFVTLTLDKTGPAAPAVTLTPDVLDFTTQVAVTHVKLRAVLNDALSGGVQSTLANAEAFIGQVGADGTGFALFPSDGLFDEVSENAYFDIPVANFALLAQGTHPISVHGLDAAGNWGDLGTANITIFRGGDDFEGPVVTGLDVVPNPTEGAATVTLTAAAADVGQVSNIAAGEWFVGPDPGPGLGFALDAADGAFDNPSEVLRAVIDVSGWTPGWHDLKVRAQDSVGNWGSLATVRLRVTDNNAMLILADSFEAAGFGAWNAAVGQVNTGPAAAMAPDGGSLGLMATVGGAAPAAADGVAAAYLSHMMPPGETTYRVTFYWDPNGTTMGSDHHDILVGLSRDTPLFGIRTEQSGGEYEVQGWVLDNGVVETTQWFDVRDGANKLHVEWKADPRGSFSLAIDDVVVEELKGLKTDAYTLYEIRLGPSANLDPAMSGTQYFDGFVAMRLIKAWLPMIWH